MALEIGAGITIGGGISLVVESGGSGATTYTVGDGTTILLDTNTGAQERLTITTNGQQAALASWTTTATLTRTGGSGTVTFDSVYSITDNGNGTWTYSFYLSPTNYPGDYLWDTLTLAAPGGGGGGGGGGTPAVTGSAQILDNTYGSIGAAKGSIGGFGELISTPDSVQFLQYNNNFGKTFIMFIQGTSSGLNISNMDIDGHTSLSLTLNGVTATSENLPTDMGGAYLRFEFTGDPFGIVAATGTFKLFSVTLL